MRNMTTLRNLISVALFTLGALVLAGAASAQQ
jgi:hypothetical protein